MRTVQVIQTYTVKQKAVCKTYKNPKWSMGNDEEYRLLGVGMFSCICKYCKI